MSAWLTSRPMAECTARVVGPLNCGCPNRHGSSTGGYHARHGSQRLPAARIVLGRGPDAGMPRRCYLSERYVGLPGQGACVNIIVRI